jgi:hypothetical protein
MKISSVVASNVGAAGATDVVLDVVGGPPLQ